MATKKITDLSVLSASDAAALDVLPIVDIDADETKKIHLSSLKSGSFSGSFQGDGSGLTGVSVDTGSLQNTIITGSLTVSGSSITDYGNQTYHVGLDQTHRVLNTNTTSSVMFIVSGSGNVGINKANPTHQLHVSSSSDPVKIENLQGGGTKFVTVTDDGVLKNSDGMTVTLSGSMVLSGSLTVSGSTINNVGPFNQTGDSVFTGQITASGHISSSGTVSMLTASIGGGIFTSASLAAGGGGGAALTVTEKDGVPSISDVTTISVSNGTLTDDGGGSVTIDTSGVPTFPFTGDAVITGSLTVSGSTINNVGPFNQTGDSVFTGQITASGHISSSGTVYGEKLQTSAQIIFGMPSSEKSSIAASGNDTTWSSEVGNISIDPVTKLTIGAGAALVANAITASGHISASGNVYGVTGSFSYLQGNSPLTVTSPISFQQAVTSSLSISASQFIGETQLLPNVTHSAAIDGRAYYLDPALYPTNTTIIYSPASEGTERIHLPHPHSCSVGYNLTLYFGAGAENSLTEISSSQSPIVNSLFGIINGGINASGGTGPGSNRSFYQKTGIRVVGDFNESSVMKFTVWQGYTGGTPAITNNVWKVNGNMNDWSGSVTWS